MTIKPGPKQIAYQEHIEPALIRLAKFCDANGIQMQAFFGLDVVDGNLNVSGRCTETPAQHAFRCTLDTWYRRHRAQYPGFVLSVMASAADRCTPQANGLPLDSYDEVEVALIRGPGYDYVMPSELGVDGFDDLFDAGNDNIASFIEMAKVDALRAALAERCNVVLPPLVPVAEVA